MEERVLAEILRHGTELVRRTVEGAISLREFLHEYGNCYYFNALDGHEASEAARPIMDKYARWCDFHRDVQTKVVDLTFSVPEGQRDLYLRAGRLDDRQALIRLREVADEHDLRTLVGIRD